MVVSFASLNASIANHLHSTPLHLHTKHIAEPKILYHSHLQDMSKESYITFTRTLKKLLAKENISLIEFKGNEAADDSFIDGQLI